MRLIRLVSQKPLNKTTLSEFECYFKDNIFIKPKSRIGLLNLSLPVNKHTIAVTDNSNFFEYKALNGANFKRITTPTGVYTQQDFLNTIN